MQEHIQYENLNDGTLKEYRCSCGKMLFKAQLFLSVVEIKCKKCGSISCFGGTQSNIGVSDGEAKEK